MAAAPRRSALEVVEGLMDRFEAMDPNEVRDKIEAAESAQEAFDALGEFGRFTSEVIDRELVIDFSSFDSALTPDAPQEFHGREGWITMWSLWLSAWDDYAPENEVEQLNDEQVLVTSHAKLRGRGSGAEMEWTTHGIWTVRDGRLVGMHNYLSREEALASAAGGLA
jgi:ketosteroid isomerase-like protein